MALHFRGFEILDIESYRQVTLTHFRISAEPDSTALLAALISTDAYDFGYASTFVSPPVASASRAIHGPWWRDSITVDRFRSTSPEAARAVLAEWVARSTNAAREPHVRARMAMIGDLLGSGAVFALDNPPDDEKHDWGDVVGRMGFHEFVVIDRSTRHLTLIVASDD